MNQNTLITKKCGTIRFIYAVRSDIFKNSEDRAKFFDIIYTVFPVLSPINTRDMIQKSLIASNLGENWLPKDFVNDISFYIKDMRVLNSIVNDYVTFVSETSFKEISGDEELMKNVQLFAMMAYKNILPDEFVKLEHEQGELYIIVRQADQIIKKKLSEMNAQIDSNIAKIKQLSSQQTVSTLNEINRLRELNAELHDKKSKIPEPIAYTMENFEEVAGNQNITEILRVLICNGYLTDRFKNYIWRKGDVFFSEKDEQYLKIVRNKEKPQFEAELDNISFVIADISVNRFCHKSILNYKIAEYLFEHQAEEHEKLDAMKQLLESDDEEVAQFLSHFLDVNNQAAKHLISFMLNNRNDIWEMISAPTISDIVRDGCLEYILINSNETELSRHQTPLLIEYLNNNTEKLAYLDQIKDKLPFLHKQGFKIKNLEDGKFPKEILSLIGEYNLWEITQSNIYYLLTSLYGYTKTEIDEKGYSLIKSLSSRTIAAYILGNLQQYIHDIMLLANHLSLEAPDFKKLILDNTLSKEDKERIIEKQESPVTFFSDCPQDMLNVLLRKNKVTVTPLEVQYLIQSRQSVSESLGFYLACNHEKYVGQLAIDSNLSLFLANSDEMIGDKHILEIYYVDQMKEFLKPLNKITNDYALAFVLSKQSYQLTQIEYKHILENNFEIAPIELARYYIPDIIKKGWENNTIAHLGIRYNHDSDTHAKLYLSSVWDHLFYKIGVCSS